MNMGVPCAGIRWLCGAVCGSVEHSPASHRDPAVRCSTAGGALGRGDLTHVKHETIGRRSACAHGPGPQTQGSLRRYSTRHAGDQNNVPLGQVGGINKGKHVQRHA